MNNSYLELPYQSWNDWIVEKLRGLAQIDRILISNYSMLAQIDMGDKLKTSITFDKNMKVVLLNKSYVIWCVFILQGIECLFTLDKYVHMFLSASTHQLWTQFIACIYYLSSQLYAQLHYWDTSFFTLRIQILSFFQ